MHYGSKKAKLIVTNKIKQALDIVNIFTQTHSLRPMQTHSKSNMYQIKRGYA